MDKEIGQKVTKREFLEFNIGLPDCRIIEKRKELGLNTISSIIKREMNVDRLKNSLNNHKYNKKQNAMKTCL